MADNETHLFANDGSDWTTPPSPVSSEEARKADQALDEEVAEEGQGPSATNETRLGNSVVEGSEESNGPEVRGAGEDEDEGDEGKTRSRSRRNRSKDK